MLLLFFLLLSLALGELTYTTESALRGWFASQGSLTTTLFEKAAGEPVLVVVISTGFPPKERRFVLSGDVEPEVVLGYNPYESSRSIIHDRDTGEQREQFYVGGNYVWLKFVIDGGLVASYNCSICEGVISISQSSQFWNLITNVSISAGHVMFDERSLFFLDATAPNKRFDCGIGISSLCRTAGTFQGHPVMFDFRLSHSKTLVPVDIFNEYVSDLHPSMSKVREWDDIHLKIGPTEITIENDHVVAAHLGLARDLTIEAYDGTDVILGYDSLRSLRFFKLRDTGEGAVVQVSSNRGFSVFGFIGLVVLALLFFRFRWSAVVFRTNSSYIAILGYYIYVRLAFDIIMLVSPGVAFANPRIWPIVIENTWFMITLISFGGYLLVLGIIALIGLCLDAPERVGWLSSSNTFRFFDTPFRQNMRNLANLKALRSAKADFDIDSSSLNPDQIEGVIRQAIMRKASLECSVTLGLLIFAMEVRRTDYDTFIIGLVALSIVYCLIDTLFIALFFTRRNPPLSWLLFVTTWSIAVAIVNLTFVIFIFVPIGRWFFQAPNVYLTLCIVLFYALLGMACVYMFPATSEHYVRFSRPIFEEKKNK